MPDKYTILVGWDSGSNVPTVNHDQVSVEGNDKKIEWGFAASGDTPDWFFILGLAPPENQFKKMKPLIVFKGYDDQTCETKDKNNDGTPTSPVDHKYSVVAGKGAITGVLDPTIRNRGSGGRG